MNACLSSSFAGLTDTVVQDGDFCTPNRRTYLASCSQRQRPRNPAAPIPHNFSLDDMKNTRIFKPARPLHSVVTGAKSDKHTEIFDALANRLLAQIDKRDILPDTIIFPDRNEGSSITLSEWLQKNKLEDGKYGYWHRPRVEHTCGSQYRLALYRKGVMSNHVAHLQLGSPTQNFAVIMQLEAQLIRDDIITWSLNNASKHLKKHQRWRGKYEQNQTLWGHVLP